MANRTYNVDTFASELVVERRNRKKDFTKSKFDQVIKRKKQSRKKRMKK